MVNNREVIVRRVSFIALALSVVCLACVDGLLTLTGVERVPIQSHNLNGCTQIAVGSGVFQHEYPCEAIITVGLSIDTSAMAIESDLLLALKDALNEWNNALTPSVGGGLPAFDTSLVAPENADVVIQFNRVDGLNKFCGQAPSRNLVMLYGFEGGTNTCADHEQARRVPDLPGVVRHEIGHIIGIPHHSQADSAVAKCAMYVPSVGDTLNPVCVHEKQILYHAFGLRRDASGDPLSVDVTQAMVTDVTIDLATWSPDSGDVQQFTRGWFTTSRIEEVEGWSHGPYSPPLPRASVQLIPSTPVTLLGSVSATDTVYSLQAVAPGSATFNVVLELDSTVIWPSPSATVQITVSAPPALPPVVASIELSTYTLHLGAPNPHSGEIHGIARDSVGTIIPGINFEWIVQDEEFVWINDQGTYVELLNRDTGTSTIKAKWGSVESTAASVVVSCAIVPCP